MIRLKDCPFCGNRPKMFKADLRYQSGYEMHISCWYCHVAMHDIFDSGINVKQAEYYMAKKWNRRPNENKTVPKMRK